MTTLILAAFSTTSAYIIGVIVAFVLILVSALVANLISFKPDRSDVKARKTWFWVFNILCPVFTFLIAFLLVYIGLRAHNQQTKYMIATSIASVISFVLYLVLGFIAAKANKHGKIGNWF